jgi:hypothetical protein
MARLLIDHSDGRYYTRPLTDEEAAARDVFDVALIPDSVYEQYLRHCDQDRTWQTLWQAISNEQYMRRREKELMPLEDAERQIARLKDDLARAQRMSRHFEEKWSEATGIQLDRHDRFEYTCIFPQPGCNIDALESEEWRIVAEHILLKYNAKLAEEGSRYQGCCCGHSHKPLSDEVADKLRKAGFLVENDSEYDEDL